jgi:flagellar protein FliS
MAMKNPYTQYRQTQVNTASPGELIVMLYNGGIQSLKKAQNALAINKVDQVNAELIKSQKIVTELQLSLNPEAGDISENLFALYDYMYRRLVEANLNKDEQVIDEILGMFEQFKQMWAQVMIEADKK